MDDVESLSIPPSTDATSDEENSAPVSFSGFANVKYHYKFVQHIGRGAFSHVFTAYHRESNTKVAIKKIKRRVARKLPLKRLKQEYDIASKLDHHNILQFYDIMTTADGQSLCFITEWCTRNVAMLIRFGGVISEEMIRNLMFDLLSGVQYLHSRRVWHRDLKPGNLLIDEQGKLKICDFGQAIEANSSTVELRPRERFGTRNFLAIEILLGRWLGCFLYNNYSLSGSRTYSSAIDMWSVGCIFAGLLRGCPHGIFTRSDDYEAIAADIFKKCGSPKEADWPGVNDLPVMKTDDLRKRRRCRLRACLPRETSDVAFELLSMLLTYCPGNRITVEDALKHVFFQLL